MDTLRLDAGHMIAHDDLAIDGKALAQVEKNRVQECEWITCERHRAIIWLVGEYPIFTETPVDT
jgi:hypothetical protein